LWVRVPPRLPHRPAAQDERTKDNVIDRIRRYLAESYSELKKVTWPTREHVRNLTILVFVISAVFGVYIGFFDIVFQQVIVFITEAFG
jgi:preprotein translocase subunit SecE